MYLQNSFTFLSSYKIVLLARQETFKTYLKTARNKVSQLVDKK